MSFKTARKAALTAALGAVVAFSGACDDLNVDNLNAPDRSRALATPSDVASLIGGAYLNYWQVSQGWSGGTSVAIASMSDHISSSWGNVGMKDFGNEPRLPVPNSPNYTYNYVMENAWFNSYGAVVAASDGLRAINSSEAVANKLGARERAFAKFMQGLGLSWIGLQFDQGFVIDETTDLQNEQELQGYQAVSDAGLGKMQEALDIASSNSFQLPTSWINGRGLSSDQFARYINSMMARHMASVPRSPDEASSVDWNAVINRVDNGIQETFSVQGEATGPWWSGIKTFGGAYDGFVRADYRRIGPAGTTGRYQQWEATPPESRSDFDMTTPDRRITGAGGPTSPGMYIFNAGKSPFPEARGTYYYSNYSDYRYFTEAWGAYAGDFVGPMIAMTPTEMDLLKAEAHIMNGQPGSAVPLINKTRTANGQLPPVDADGTEGENCVPRTIEGNCGDLLEALQHEKRMEVYQVSGGIPWFDDRRWGDLLTGTAIHFPIPGAELQVLQKEIYTYGGGGEGSAPSAVPLPGEEGFDVLERVDYSLDALKRQQESFSEKPTTKQ